MNAYAACGDEEYSSEPMQNMVKMLWIDYLTPFVDESNVDAYGTAYGIIKSDTPDPLRVVIEAHVDEMLMGIISNRWFVACQYNGGSDNMIAASKGGE
jgi:hypothetical protein